MSTSGPLAANRTLFKDLGYDPEKELTPISLFATLPNIIVVNSKLPPNTLLEFVDEILAAPRAPRPRVTFDFWHQFDAACELEELRLFRPALYHALPAEQVDDPQSAIDRDNDF